MLLLYGKVFDTSDTVDCSFEADLVCLYFQNKICYIKYGTVDFILMFTFFNYNLIKIYPKE